MDLKRKIPVTIMDIKALLMKPDRRICSHSVILQASDC
jgi:hypothetical protein